MPARPRSVLPQPPRDPRAEFQHPIADALVREIEPALRKQLLNVAIAQRGADKAKPRVDDNRRETMPVIRDRRHAAAYDRFAPTARVTLTMPWGVLTCPYALS